MLVLLSSWSYFCFEAVDLTVGFAIDGTLLMALEIATDLLKKSL